MAADCCLTIKKEEIKMTIAMKIIGNMKNLSMTSFLMVRKYLVTNLSYILMKHHIFYELPKFKSKND
ncbi:hypothetical protein GCM10009431_03590 [Gaetbulibacter jejuensis]|uniref:Uncharacterized protein n=1 Tax=Gaetbulibacter jejuensis TaxID=584607 RepID=A0ABN1JEN4_9FLAO